MHSSPNIDQVIKLRRMRWVGHVAHMGGEVYTGFWQGNLRERDHLENPGVDGRMGTKGAVCGHRSAHSAGECVLPKPEKCHVLLPSPLHACPHHGPWASSSDG
jgi:hypothetical protein